MAHLYTINGMCALAESFSKNIEINSIFLFLLINFYVPYLNLIFILSSCGKKVLVHDIYKYVSIKKAPSINRFP